MTTMAVAKLKRARNSLLNVSRLPPEVLGDIFSRNVTTNPARGGLEGSRNFLFVCHHWFEVASRTPEVWSCWGLTREDWKKWHLRCPTAPLDLILDGRESSEGALDENLQNSLRDRTARGKIRKIHVISKDSELLSSLISSLTPNCEVTPPSGAQTVIVMDENTDSPVNVSEFLARNRFPRLKHLALDGCIISSWDPVVMVSQTSNLTNLGLFFGLPLPVPTMSQIRSIIASNPTLQDFSLGLRAAPKDVNTNSPQLPLPNLRELELVGDLRFIFGLLSQLDYPRNMDKLMIQSLNGAVEDIPKVVGPYLRHYLQHHRRPGGLGLLLSSKLLLEFHVDDIGGLDFYAPEPEQAVPFVEIILRLDPYPPKDTLTGAGLDLIAHVPSERVFSLVIIGDPVTMEDASARLPNLRALRFEDSPLHVAFPRPTQDENADIYPCVQHVTLDLVSVEDKDWSPMITFLKRRANSGNKLGTLWIIRKWMDPLASSVSKRLVREFKFISR